MASQLRSLILLSLLAGTSASAATSIGLNVESFEIGQSCNPQVVRCR